MYTWRPLGSDTCRSSVSIGVAAWRTARAPSTANSGSGASGAGCRSHPGGLHAHAAHRLGAQAVEERRHRLLHLRPAGDALPVRLDRAGQRVAAVDRRDRVRRRVGQAVDDQPLDVGLEALEHRVQLDHPAPGFEVELALGRARRARVQRDDAPGRRRVHEEREPDRDLEARPHVVGQSGGRAATPCGSRSGGTPDRPSAAPSSSRRRTRSGARPGAAGGGGRRGCSCRRGRTIRRRPASASVGAAPAERGRAGP